MPQPIAYYPSGPISGSIRGGTLLYSVDGDGIDYINTTPSFWTVEVPASGSGYVFVTDSFSQGITGEEGAYPIFFQTAGSSSAQVLATVNTMRGVTSSFNDVQAAFQWMANSGKWLIIGQENSFDKIDASGLVLYVDAGKLNSYPTTGSLWRDLSGNNASGSLNNGVSFITSSKSLYFDGTDDEVYVPNYDAINMSGNQQYTAMATVYPLLGGTTWHGVFSKGNLQQYALTINSPNAYLHYESNQGGVSALNSATGSVTVNRWQHVAVRFDGTNKTIWKNGQILVTQAASNLNSTSNTEPLRIGEGNTGEQFRGQIHSVQVYRRSLSTAEMLQNYYGGNIVTDGLVFAADASNLVSYESSSTTTYSLTGSLSGSLVNGVGYSNMNGGGWVFDGIDDYISVPYSTILTPPTMSIATWVSCSWNSLSGQRCIVSKTQFGGYQLSINEPTYYPSGLGVIFFLGGAYRSASINTSTISPGWHYIVSTFDGQYIRLYLDGIEKNNYNYGSQTTITYNNINHFVIGAEPGNGTIIDGAFFPGKISSTYVYDKALTAAEVAQNFNAQRQRFGV